MSRQPHYDRAFGELCRWLMSNGLTMHSTRDGTTTLAKKKGKPHPYTMKPNNVAPPR